MRARQRERLERQGFEDALEIGRPTPFYMPDAHQAIYDQGFKRGQRAVKRIRDGLVGSRP